MYESLLLNLPDDKEDDEDEDHDNIYFSWQSAPIIPVSTAVFF